MAVLREYDVERVNENNFKIDYYFRSFKFTFYMRRERNISVFYFIKDNNKDYGEWVKDYCIFDLGERKNSWKIGNRKDISFKKRKRAEYFLIEEILDNFKEIVEKNLRNMEFSFSKKESDQSIIRELFCDPDMYAKKYVGDNYFRVESFLLDKEGEGKLIIDAWSLKIEILFYKKDFVIKAVNSLGFSVEFKIKSEKDKGIFEVYLEDIYKDYIEFLFSKKYCERKENFKERIRMEKDV